VVHSADGLIVTNNHVVEDAKTIQVTLHDGRVFDAEVVGRDPESDLAVIRIAAHGLPAARWAEVDAIRPGQFAIAIGMPLGFDYSVTVGHVSALGRAGLNPRGRGPFGGGGPAGPTIQNFIQTDTVINPGNSGGPLINLHGEVMGINSMVHGGVGGGFGFAIPADLVQRVAGQLIEHGRTSRAWVGLSLGDLKWERAQELGMERAEGAVVHGVHEGGPASAKLRTGDVIVAVDGQPVRGAGDVVYLVSQHLAGEKLELTWIRDGKRKTAKIEAGSRRKGLAEMSGGGE
jgi:serine protease Do